MAIYFASSLATGGGNGSFSNPWTLQEGMAVESPDERRIIADGTYSPTTTLSPTGIGSANNPVLITGCSLTGDVDGTKADISGATLPSETDILDHPITQNITYKNLIVRNSPRHGIACSSSSGNTNLHFNNIDILNNAQWGATPLTNYNARFSFTNCRISGNMYGIGSPHNYRMPNLKLIACTIENNSNTGIHVANELIVLKTVVKNNGIGIRANITTPERWLISNSTFYKNTNAIDVGSGSLNLSIIESNIFRNNIGFAFKSGNTIIDRITIMNNCFSNNSSGDSESGSITGNGNIHDDPLFVSEVEGEEDFNLQPTSPCINTGLNPYGY
jgi:hypothetical protein